MKFVGFGAKDRRQICRVLPRARACAEAVRSRDVKKIFDIANSREIQSNALAIGEGWCG